MGKTKVTVFWFRRDLRLTDNKGLYYALKSSENVLPLFIFDDHILKRLPRQDHRVEFIYHLLIDLDRELRQAGSGLLVRKGEPLEVFARLLKEFSVEAVFCNGDHEPYGQQRDQQVRALLGEHHVSLLTSLDHLIMEKLEVLKTGGSPYLVFTPYSRQWKKVITQKHYQEYPSQQWMQHLYKGPVEAVFPFEKTGFVPSGMKMPPPERSEQVMGHYDKTRDFPALEGTSRLGPHLRFGTVSIRELVKKACSTNETFLNELIWREFYAMILWHYPQVSNHAFRPGYDRIPWRNDEADFERWTRGLTGFPMVDAGMRQLNATGYMHNRLRMVTAGFLSKQLLIDWRWGMDYFAQKLFDFELSSNNGGWQWCAGTGTDAAPYFRIFNPGQQQKKFDPQMVFIRQWIPEYGTSDYPAPMVDHKAARERCIRAYQQALSER